MNQYNPKVSIVIPVYNGANYLSEAIESALAQTYKNIEILVVNDGSNDAGATRNIALSYGDKIRYFEKQNGGSSSALNYGILNMEGEWFSWLSHDDLYDKKKVEEQIRFLNSIKDSQINEHVLFTGYNLVDAKGKIIREFNEKKSKQMSELLETLNGENSKLISELCRFTFHGCSCLIHKETLQKVGYFNETLRLINDVDLWYRIYACGVIIHYIPKTLVSGRMHSAQISRTIGFSYHNTEQDKLWQERYNWILQKHPKEYSLFFQYGREAFSKTRIVDGKRAFSYLRKNKAYTSAKLTIYEIYYILKAFMYHFFKKIYLKIKV